VWGVLGMANMTFIGRGKELEALGNFYNSDRFEMVTIYGRRRVGKTELIKEFLRDKKSVYFLATEGNYRENLAGFARALHGTMSAVTYRDFHSAIDAVCKLAEGEKIVLAIDEYPYLAKSYKPFSSLLQHAIDHKFQHLNMMIILCGSSTSFMENEVDGYKSPLYGRRTGQLKLFPLDFETTRKFFPNSEKQEQAVLHGITGGIPKYLLEVRQNETLEDNIKRMFFRPQGLLFEEPNNLMKQELREPALYNTIIGAIATGSSRLNEIVTKIDAENFDSAKCNKYIKTLVDIHIVKRELPIMDKPTSKKSIYRLNDGMFRFWYRYVYPNLSQISLDYGDAVYNYISGQISDFMGDVFEDICKQYLWRENMAGKLPFQFLDCGRWWGTNPIAKTEQEIDILACSSDKSKLLFCECKWTNEQVDNRVLDDLINKSAMFDCTEKYYMLLSKSGFKASLKERENERIILVDFTSM
jgi:AAA+ ATPase superfamily predicted ATPase